jgi:multidrug resistance efflux pump
MRRNGRILLGVGLLGLGAWTTVPELLHPTSTDAVVNAEVVTVRAPVDGVLSGGQGVAVGDRVTAGDALAHIRALNPDTARRDALTLDLAAQRQLLAALLAEDRELAALDRELAGRAAAYRTATSRRNVLARDEAAAELRAAEAQQAAAAAELARKQTLFDKDLLAPPALAGARAAMDAAAARVNAALAAAAQVAAEGRAVARGAMAGNGAEDTSYANQRRDEVRLRRAGRQVEIAQARTRVAELDRQLGAEARRADQAAEAGLRAPVTGVVWSRFASDGASVRAGDAVMGVVDCGKLFLTAVLPKRYFASLKAGDTARAHLAGTDEPVTAVVESVRASATQANAAAAVTPAVEDGREVVVTLAVHGNRLGNRSDNLCQVGQHAHVTLAVPALRPLVDAMAAGVRYRNAS